MASKATPTDLEATTPSRDETPPAKRARRAVTKAAPKTPKAKAKSKAAPKTARAEEKPAQGAEAEAEAEARDESDDDVMVGEIAGEGADGEPRDVEVPEAKSSDAGLRSYDPMQAYLHEVRRHALLTPDEEHALAVRYAETGDVEAAARMVTANLRLVVKIAYEYRRAYRNLMDIIQEGNIGLMQAVKRYDPYRGVKLSSYAAWWIRAYILRFILNNWRLVKLGTTQVQRKLFFNLNKEKQRLASMGIDPTSSELARRLDVPENEVVDMDRRLSGGDVSLDAPLGDGDGKATTRMDLLPASGASVDEALSGFELDDMVRARLAAFEQTLSGKDITIFRDRLVADDPATLQEIGERYGISRERVRQLEKRLQDKLRVYLQSELGEALQFH
ncbi:MAG: RNA polymerase factor sigma-32 [Polyangiales bacterium]